MEMPKKFYDDRRRIPKKKCGVIILIVPGKEFGIQTSRSLRRLQPEVFLVIVIRNIKYSLGHESGLSRPCKGKHF